MIRLLALTAVLIGTLSVAEAETAAETYALCSDGTRVLQERIFRERYPHETCTPLESCPPMLVETVVVLAQKRCQRAALGVCQASGDDRCEGVLTRYWQQLSEASAQLARSQADRVYDRAPPVLQNRIDAPETWAPQFPQCDSESCQALARKEHFEALLRALARVEGN